MCRYCYLVSITHLSPCLHTFEHNTLETRPRELSPVHSFSLLPAPKSATSRLPVSQFDFGAAASAAAASTSTPTSAVASKKSSVKHAKVAQEPSTPSLDAEFWELQQTVTMLKRRLKCQMTRLPSEEMVGEALEPADSLDTEEVFNFSLR